MEAKDLIEYFGYKPEDIKTIDDLKTKFNEDFIRVSQIHKDSEPVKKIIGETLGGMQVEMIRIAKKHGLEKDEFLASKDNKITDKLAYVLDRKVEQFSTIENEYKTKLEGTSDEVVKALEKKLEKESTKRKEVESLLETTKSTLEKEKENFSSQIKNTKLAIKKNDILSKIEWAEGIDDLKKEGFLSKFEKTYDLDIDDTDEPVIFERSKKEKIKSTKTVGTFKTPLEVLQEEGLKFGVWKQNRDSGKPAGKKPEQQQQQYQQTIGGPQRRLSSLVQG